MPGECFHFVLLIKMVQEALAATKTELQKIKRIKIIDCLLYLNEGGGRHLHGKLGKTLYMLFIIYNTFIIIVVVVLYLINYFCKTASKTNLVFSFG